MTRTIFTAALLAALTAPAAFAMEPVEGAMLGTEPSEISAALGESGYTMTRYERERGRIELTAVKEARRVEVYLDPASGAVTRVEEYRRGGSWPLPGADDGEIRAGLEADGYEIVKYERERGRIEVYADRDGRRWELKIDPRDGRIVEVEAEDD
ncbi:MAG: PepSY domain-containing protein [Pseudomonadota bacterium]